MKETKADRTKAFILEKVSPIFNAQGYAGTSLTDVLNATGLTKGSVYGNFVNKEDLAQKAFSYNLMRVFKPLQQATLKDKNAVKKLKAITNFYREYYQLMSELGGCPILNVVNDAKGVNNTLYADAIEAARILTTNLEEIIKLGIKQKRIRKKTDAKALATLIYSMLQGAIFMSYIEQNDAPLQVTCDAIDEIIQTKRK
jgi:AcrR family transcriptional regulator